MSAGIRSSFSSRPTASTTSRYGAWPPASASALSSGRSYRSSGSSVPDAARVRLGASALAVFLPALVVRVETGVGVADLTFGWACHCCRCRAVAAAPC